MNGIKYLLGGVVVFNIVVMSGCKCNNNRSVQNDVDSLADTSDVIETPDSFSMEVLKQKDSIEIFRNDSLSNTLRSLSIQKESWRDAHLVYIDTLQEEVDVPKVNVDKAFLKKYASILNVSPDGKNILDQGSDNMIDDHGTFTEADPETNIYIIDKGTGAKIRLAQLGASGHMEQVHWLDNNHVVMLCALPGKDPKKDDTYLYFYSIGDHVVKTYRF